MGARAYWPDDDRLEPDADPDDDVWFVVPGTKLAVVVPLGAVPRFLDILDHGAATLSQPVCGQCGGTLPTWMADSQLLPGS